MYKVIGLTRDKMALVDADDYEWLRQWDWSYHNAGYACRVEKTPNGSQMVLMHRAILRAEGDVYVDHINGKKWDNRRCNLRIATPRQSAYNTTKVNRTGYRGVSVHAGRNKPYQARIRISGRVSSLGYFSTAREAAVAYDIAAKEHHGEFAKLNFAR